MAAEIKRPSSVVVVAVLVGALLLVALAAVGLAQYAGFAMQDELERKVLSRPSPELAALREHELARLSLYQWVDQKKGIVRIPVDEALQLVLRERSRPTPPPAAPDAVAPGRTP